MKVIVRLTVLILCIAFCDVVNFIKAANEPAKKLNTSTMSFQEISAQLAKQKAGISSQKKGAPQKMDCNMNNFQLVSKLIHPLKVEVENQQGTFKNTLHIKEGSSFEGPLAKAIGSEDGLIKFHFTIDTKPIVRRSYSIDYRKADHPALYLRIKEEGGKYTFGSQTGPLNGLKGITESGCKLTKNIKVKPL